MKKKYFYSSILHGNLFLYHLRTCKTNLFTFVRGKLFILLYEIKIRKLLIILTERRERRRIKDCARLRYHKNVETLLDKKKLISTNKTNLHKKTLEKGRGQEGIVLMLSLLRSWRCQLHGCIIQSRVAGQLLPS